MEGRLFTHKKEKNILTTIRLDEMLQYQFDTISMDKKMKDLVELVKRSDKNIFALHDGRDRFVGIIELNHIKQKQSSIKIFQ